MRWCNLVVSRLPEEDGRRVAEVDDDIPHRLDTLRPSAPRRVAFLVARWHGVYNAVFVEGAHRRGLRSNVHPADEVRIRLTDELCVEVLHPLRRNTDCRPFVSRTLRIASEPCVLSVDEKSTLRRVVLHLAEASADRLAVEHGTILVKERDNDIIEVGGIRRPEDKTFCLAARLDVGDFGSVYARRHW